MGFGEAAADGSGRTETSRLLKTWPLGDDNGSDLVFSRGKHWLTIVRISQ